MNVNVVYRDVVLDPIVTSVQWSGDVTLPYRTLSVSLANTIDGTKRVVPIELGREIRLYVDGVEQFRGIIFAHNIDDHGQMNVTAYDENVYLTKNMDTLRFASGTTASGIIRQICSTFGIPTGTIADTGLKLQKLILRDKPLWEMIVIALTETRKQNGRRFFVYADKGKLNVDERKGKVVEWLLEDGVNIVSSSYSQSIEDMKTQVKVLGGDQDKKPLVATLKNDALIAKYGIMQHLENADSELKQSQLQQLARQLLADLGKITDIASVEALGIVDVIAGSAVYVKESMTGIVGAYYVSTDTHVWENGVHKMSLSLSATDDLPKMEYDEPAQKKKKDDGTNLTAAQVDKLLS